jgi:hypothetical protein
MIMQADGRLALPVEILMTVAQHTHDFGDLVALCSICRVTSSASGLLMSHWLQSRKLETSLEILELYALGFLRRHIHGEQTNHP